MGASVGHYEDMGDGFFRKVRQELGVEAFGVNVLVLEPGVDARAHYHHRQDELYFVHEGSPTIVIEGEEHALRPGSLAHVPAAVRRQVRNRGEARAVVLVIGGAGGYVGRDGERIDPF
jgi:uncharacterized cupin superfamily protein